MIWTDVVQMILILLGTMVLLIKGSIDAGGPTYVWKTAVAGGRINFDE